MNLYKPQDSFDILENLKEKYSNVKGELTGLELMKDSVKSILMKKSNEQSLGAQEREAKSSQQFQDHCQKIAEATRIEALLKLEMTIAQMKFEAWRTEQASNRTMERLTR
jgi:hypothetical protein